MHPLYERQPSLVSPSHSIRYRLRIKVCNSTITSCMSDGKHSECAKNCWYYSNDSPHDQRGSDGIFSTICRVGNICRRQCVNIEISYLLPTVHTTIPNSLCCCFFTDLLIVWRILNKNKNYSKVH